MPADNSPTMATIRPKISLLLLDQNARRSIRYPRRVAAIESDEGFRLSGQGLRKFRFWLGGTLIGFKGTPSTLK
jgi:hypothetical protein